MNLLRGLRRLGQQPAEGKTYTRVTPYPYTAGSAIGGSIIDVDRATKHGFSASSWVYRCVSMSMELGSTIPLGLQRMDANGKWAFDWSAPESALLAYWNDDFGAEENVQRLIAHLLLNGNAIIGMETSATAPKLGQFPVRQLVVESPIGVNPVANVVGGIARYDRPNGLTWEPGDIIHARMVDPQNPFWGLGRLQALARVIDTDVASVLWNQRRLEGGGVPDGILIDQTITDSRARDKAQQEISETWHNIRGPFIVGQDSKWLPLGLSNEDLQWLAGREFSMREICIGFGYNPAIFGADATYHNSGAAERQKWAAIVSILRVLVSAMTRGLISRERRSRERIWYDTSGVEALKALRSQDIKDLAGLLGTGTPYDQGKAFLGLDLPDLPDGLGKISLINGSFDVLARMVAGDGSDLENQPPADDDAPLDEPDPFAEP
jgi:phage portal protein BeeE